MHLTLTKKYYYQLAVPLLNKPRDLAEQTSETFRQTLTVPGQHHRPASSQQCSADALLRGYLDPTSGQHESRQQPLQNTAGRDSPKYKEYCKRQIFLRLVCFMDEIICY